MPSRALTTSSVARGCVQPAPFAYPPPRTEPRSRNPKSVKQSPPKFPQLPFLPLPTPRPRLGVGFLECAPNLDPNLLDYSDPLSEGVSTVLTCVCSCVDRVFSSTAQGGPLGGIPPPPPPPVTQQLPSVNRQPPLICSQSRHTDTGAVSSFFFPPYGPFCAAVVVLRCDSVAHPPTTSQNNNTKTQPPSVGFHVPSLFPHAHSVAILPGPHRCRFCRELTAAIGQLTTAVDWAATARHRAVTQGGAGASCPETKAPPTIEV